MSYLTHLKCHRCGEEYPPGPYFSGCPSCPPDRPSNLYCVYDYEAVARVWDPRRLRDREPSLWRYIELLPVDAEHKVTLGEGMTPLIHLERLGARLGLDRLYLKDESQNPTWSFKDRMASVGASMARAMGRTVLTAASSGNGGAAVAAYAARAGMKAIILTTPQFPMPMRVFMQAYGSMVLATESTPDRWKLVRLGVERDGWFPIQNFQNPPIGANPYAQEGCKALGFEICEQLGWDAPAAIVFPITTGDTLVGTWRGCTELKLLGTIDRIPRMFAAEVFGPLKRALDDGLDQTVPMPTRPSVAFSAASSDSAYQSLRAVRESGGDSVVVGDDDAIIEMQLQLAQDEGIYAEAAAVMPLLATQRLVEAGTLSREMPVVVVSTSGGMKDPATTGEHLQSIPLIEPTVEALTTGLRDHYGYDFRPS